MSNEVTERRLQRERSKVAVLERVIEDQTRRLYLANEDLRKSQHYLESLHRVMPGALFVISPDRLVCDANEAATRLYGGSPRGVSVAELILDAVAPLDSSGRLEVTFKQRTGHQVPVLLSRRRRDDGMGEVWVAIDLSEQKRLEAKLRQSHKMQALGTMASGIAHEFNTAVQYIKDNMTFLEDAFADLTECLEALRDAVEQAPPEMQKACGDIHEQFDIPYLFEEIPRAFSSLKIGTDRVASVVRAMKSFAHPHPVARTAYDLNRAIRDVAMIATPECRNVAELQFELGEIPSVRGNPDEISTVVLNLIVNAAHAIREAKRDCGVIKVQTNADEEYVQIRVADNGAGIPPDVRGRVFEPFFTTKSVGEGTGQGLSMVHGIVTRHDGDISFETEVDVGTTFTITLPIASTEKRT